MSRISVAPPRNCPTSVKSVVLHSISLAQFALAYARGWAANCPNARVRLKSQLDRAKQEIALLREQMRSKDARMASIPPPQATAKRLGLESTLRRPGRPPQRGRTR